MSFAYVENNIEAWGYTKGILGPNGFGTAEGQVLKTLEETNELEAHTKPGNAVIENVMAEDPNATDTTYAPSEAATYDT